MDLAIEDDPPRVRVDPMELATAVGNLLSNAIQALPDGRGRVTLRAFSVDKAVLPDDATGADLAGLAALRIEVEDTGAGMTAVQASRALEPFYSSRPDGKGLGLVGVLSTVKGAGGALWFRSEPGVGTRFVLWLPAGPAEEPLSVAPTATLPREVLFVDDDPEITTVLRLLLESLGVRAHCCASGEAALRYLRSSQCPDLRLAVVDIRLGAMDGIELSHRLLHTHGFAGILLISGDEPGPRLAQFAGQAVEFRRKPLGRDSLRAALEALLSTASGAPSPRIGERRGVCLVSASSLRARRPVRSPVVPDARRLRPGPRGLPAPVGPAQARERRLRGGENGLRRPPSVRGSPSAPAAPSSTPATSTSSTSTAPGAISAPMAASTASGRRVPGRITTPPGDLLSLHAGGPGLEDGLAGRRMRTQALERRDPPDWDGISPTSWASGRPACCRLHASPSPGGWIHRPAAR